jgi:membrane associated rhomboid family serine protease
VQLPVGGDDPPRAAPLATATHAPLGTATHAPLAVAAIALLDIALFVWMASMAPHDATAFVDRHGLVPREFLRALANPAAGSAYAFWMPLTSMFLHADPLHLAGNLVFLWIFGGGLEQRLGHARFLLFFLACGLAAAAFHVASAPDSFLATLGASGAVSGLLGAYVVGGPLRRIRLVWPRIDVSAPAFLLLWLALQIAAGLASWAGGESVAGWAHVGGFAAGALLARGLSAPPAAHARLRS